MARRAIPHLTLQGQDGLSLHLEQMLCPLKGCGRPPGPMTRPWRCGEVGTS